MRQKKVQEILLPYKECVPLQPFVRLDDKITDAIELMVNSNLKSVAVVRNDRAVGIVLLKDAFRKIGLHLASEE